MKIFKMILCAAAVLVALTACGSEKDKDSGNDDGMKTAYNREAAKNVADKIETAYRNGESIELSDADFNTMLNQMLAITQYGINQMKQWKDHPEKAQEWRNSDEFMEMDREMELFSWQLENGRINDSQQKNLEDFKKKVIELGKIYRELVRQILF